METWVLRDQFKGEDIYFLEWTGIGPRGTKDLQKAHKFNSRMEAIKSPAYKFALTNYCPLRING